MTTIFTVTACMMDRDLGTGFAESSGEKEYRFATKEEMLAKFDELKASAEVETYRRGSRNIKLATNLATFSHEFEDASEAAEYLADGLNSTGKETNMECWEAQ